jgi:hypothetical protein
MSDEIEIKEEVKRKLMTAYALRLQSVSILSDKEINDLLISYAQGIDDGYVQGYIDALTFESKHESYESMSIPELAIELKRLKEELDKFDRIKKTYQGAYDYLSISVLPERMDEEDIDTMKIANVGRLQTSADIRCNIPAANKEKVQEWLKENGHGSMVKAEINASTFKAFVKERIKEGKEYPDDLIKVDPYTRATVVKA